jgi:hypothetical protein
MMSLRCFAVILGIVVALGTAGLVGGVFAACAYLIRKEEISFEDEHVFVLCAFLAAVCGVIGIIMLVGSCMSFRTVRIVNVAIEFIFLGLVICVLLFMIGPEPLAYRLIEKIWDEKAYEAGMLAIEEKIQCCGWTSLRDKCDPSSVTCKGLIEDLITKNFGVLAGVLFGILTVILVAAVVQIIDIARNSANRRVGNDVPSGHGLSPARRGRRAEYDESPFVVT